MRRGAAQKNFRNAGTAAVWFSAVVFLVLVVVGWAGFLARSERRGCRKMVFDLYQSYADIESAEWAELARQFSPPCVPELLEALQTHDSSFQARILTVLGTLEDPRAEETLLAWGRRAELFPRTQALQALGRVRCPEAAEVLFEALGDPNLSVREAAKDALVVRQEPGLAREVLWRYLDADPDIRGVLVDFLRDSGSSEEAIEILASRLEEGEVEQRSNALSLLVQLVAGKSLPESQRDRVRRSLLELVAAANPVLRAEAIRALGTFGFRECIPDLVRLLGRDDVGVREKQEIFMVFSEFRAVEVVPTLVDLLESRSGQQSDLVHRLGEALNDLVTEAHAGELGRALEGSRLDEAGRQICARLLGKHGGAAHLEVLFSVADRFGSFPASGLEAAIAGISRRDPPRSIPRLVRRMERAAPWELHVLSSLLEELTFHVPSEPIPFGPLSERSESKGSQGEGEDWQRARARYAQAWWTWWAAEGQRSQGEWKEEAFREASRALDPSTLRQGPGQASSGAELADRVRLVGRLARMNHPDSLKALLVSLADPEDAVWAAASEAIRRLGPGPEVRKSLRETAAGRGLPQAARAIELLLGLRDSDSVPILVECLGHPEPLVRLRAAEGMGILGVVASRSALARLLDDPDSDVARAAQAALGKMLDQSVADELRAMLELGSAQGKSRAAELLGQLRDKSSVPALLALLEHPSWSVRASSSEALASIFQVQWRLSPETLPHTLRQKWQRWIEDETLWEAGTVGD